jgi:2-oxoisovalerate dehydrogenase E2 component (dihydrolipoyl transacylase)
MNVFNLPDLGEGLQEAEIVEWLVMEGDEVAIDQPILSVETAKAIVDVPSPMTGRIKKLFVKAGDIPKVGDPLVEFESTAAHEERKDTGTVVGQMEVNKGVMKEEAAVIGKASSAGGGLKATPAVRALAHRLNVDLTVVTPTGADGVITANDVQRAAKVLEEAGPLQPLRGVRRAMAHIMAQAHAEVADVTIIDDADINAWPPGSDATLRLIRAIVIACKVEPSLNAWFDSKEMGRRLLDHIDIAVAVDTPDGLFVPVLRNVAKRTNADLREALNKIKADVRARTIPPEEMRGCTFTLSNFGTFGGRYADPIVVPPTVAILGAGRIREEVVAVSGQAVVHRILPLSLSVDHRAVTGGEAARFLMAVIKDLQKAE